MIRSALFTPGTEAARMRKAVTTGADVCIFDLEDSVPADRLIEARETIRLAVEELSGQVRIWVRVHQPASKEMPLDLAAIPLQKVQGIMLPKVRHSDDVRACHAALTSARAPSHLALVPIIESAIGVLNSAEIAASTGVFCLALGRFDLSADLGIDPDGGSPALATARGAVVLASAAARVHPPLDSPWLKITDLDGLRGAAQRGRADGFGGMLLIHPSHVATVNEVFSPTSTEMEWARGIMAATEAATSEGRGAFSKDGEMVDAAIVKRARGILERANP
ncbi:MAG TPA: CoA ester lyase [Candidatus Dormibacteraeota bacterium]|jgi:citrate lyase beta subunit